MAKIIYLKALNKALRLSIEQNQWCSIFLINSDEVFLGADMFNDIRCKIIDALKNYNKLEICAKNFNGNETKCVMLIHEEYTSFYISKQGNIFVFYLLDKEAKLIDNITITDREKDEWIKILHVE